MHESEGWRTVPYARSKHAVLTSHREFISFLIHETSQILILFVHIMQFILFVIQIRAVYIKKFKPQGCKWYLVHTLQLPSEL